jgi:hypothetical protein
MEGRALLSTVATTATTTPTAAEVARAANKVWAEHLAAEKASPKPTVIQRGKFVLGTAWSGYKLTHSKNVAEVGLSYAKQTVSHDSRKVAAAYLNAIFHGNMKTVNQLNHDNLVKQVGKQYVYLSHSSPVRRLGNQFVHFGRDVSTEFHHLFG